MTPEDPPKLASYQRLQRACYLAIISGSPNIDRFSDWTLAGIGVVFGAMAANLDSVTHHISLCSLRWVLGSFIASALCAGVQKFSATVVRSGSEAYKTMIAEADIPKSELEQFLKSLPEPFWRMNRPSIERAMQRGQKDLIYGSKLLLWWFQLQGRANIFQFLFVLLGFVFLLLGLR